MADDGGNPEKEADKKIIHVYPLVKVKSFEIPFKFKQIK